MKTTNLNPITLGLIAVGAVSLASAARADEKPSAVQTALSSTTISGFVDTSTQWNLGSGNANAPGYIFGGASKSDGFNLNVIKLVIEKDAGLSDEWGAGYKVDLLFGPDANTYGTQSTSATGASDFAVKQAYVDLKAPLGNGLEFKLGVWDTILGYEVFESPLNPNFTKSYGYTIEPATFTGIQSTYNISEFISVTAGIADSESSSINKRSNPPQAESYKTYLGDISLTAPSTWGWFGGSSLFGAVVNGFSPAATAFGLSAATPADQTSIYVGGTMMTPIKALKVGGSFDYESVGGQTVAGTAVRSSYAEAFGLYVLYQATEKLAINGRGEWFTQSEANSVGSLPAKVLALTATAQYDLWKNVLTRVEFRWDHQADGTADAFGGVGPVAGTLRNSYEIIGNVVYKF